MEPKWIPRNENGLADYLSCIIDYDDWGLLNQEIFAHINELWGPHSVDRFASEFHATEEHLLYKQSTQ